MSYPEQGETMLTVREAVLMRRLLGVIDIKLVELLIVALEDVKGCDFARVTIIQRDGITRFVEQTKTVE